MTAPSQPEPRTDETSASRIDPSAELRSTVGPGHDSAHHGDPGPDPAAGDLLRIGRFVVLRELGRGSMGVVYTAYDEELDRKIALKLMRVDLRDRASFGRNQLLREAQALARLAHPNVVAVHEAGVFAGSVYIAMEYVQGIDLLSWTSARARPWRDVVAVFLQAGEGLLAAHRRGLVHRDFKPGNVLVGDDGRVRVADFGLAAHRDAPATTLPSGRARDPEFTSSSGNYLEGTLAVEGALVGTPAYMAPEQLRRGPATAASDQFAFCVALYEALYGERPFTGATVEALTRSVEHDPPRATPPRPEVPRWLHALLLRGLDRDPARRFPSMAELLALLARDPEAERQRRRQRLTQLLGAVVLTALVVVGGIQAYGALARNAAERRAEARLDALQEQLTSLHAAGRDDEARRLLDAFAELPDNRGTPALAAAYLGWAALLDEHAAAIDALAAAYIAATDADAEQAALRGLVARLTARGAENEAAAVLATLDAHAPGLAADPELAPARVAAALHRRDLGAARDVLAGLPADHPARLYLPTLEHLSRGTVYPMRHFGELGGLSSSDGVADLDGDGRPELLSHRSSATGHASLHRLAPGYPQIRDLHLPPYVRAHPLPHALAGEPTVLVEVVRPPAGEEPAQSRRYELIQLGPDDTRRSLLEFDDHSGYALAVADVDGDGAPALYFGSGPYQRRLSRVARGPDGAWTRSDAHPPSDALYSDYNAITAADLDGDGRSELLVALGPWSAYDLRVLRARGDGLELVARRSFGSIASVTTVRVGDETLIALSKRDEYASPIRFGPDQPLGELAGIYVLALRGDQLELRQFIPDEPKDGPRRNFRYLHAGDLDGDGQDDLIAGCHQQTALLLRGPDGFHEPLLLRELEAHVIADIDDDPQVELLSLLPGDEPSYVALGEGDTPVVPRAQAVLVARPPPVEIADPAIAAAWGHAEELAAIGLPGRSAAELAAIAGLAGPVREDMLLRAAELHAIAGEHAAAAPLFLAAAARTDLADAALAGAAASRRELGEFAAAEALVGARLALPDLPAQARAGAEAERARLRSATAPRSEQRLRFDVPLDPAWRIHDPLAVARTPGTGALSFRSSLEPVAAELPRTWDGGSFGIAVELEVDYAEWGDTMVIGLRRPDEPEAWFGVRLICNGGTDNPNFSVEAFERSTGVRAAHHLQLADAHGLRVRATITLHPELELGAVTLETAGQPPVRDLFRVRPDARPGPLNLALMPSITNPHPAAHARVTAIDLVGLGPAPHVEPGPLAAVAQRIAENELGAALDALDALGEPATGTAPALWRADLLARLARPDADAALAHALGPEPMTSPLLFPLFQRLRRPRDGFTPVARAVLGLDHPGLRYFSFTVGAAPRPDLVEDALTDLADLPPPAPDAAPEDWLEHVTLLQTRARAWQLAGRNDLARRDLEALEPIYAAHPTPALESPRVQTALSYLDIVAALGDVEATRRAARAFLELRSDAAVALEVLQRRKPVAALLSADEWAGLAETARRLSAGH